MFHIQGICSGMLAGRSLGTRRNCKLVFYLLWRMRLVPLLTPVQTDFQKTCPGSANQNHASVRAERVYMVADYIRTLGGVISVSVFKYTANSIEHTHLLGIHFQVHTAAFN